MKKGVKKLLDFLYKRPEVVFVLIAVPFGAFSAFYVPQMSVTDEDSHLLRAYQVARGEFVCHKSSMYPQDVIDMFTKDFSDVSDVIDESDQKKFVCGSAAGYAPIAYIPQAVGITFAKATHPTVASMVFMARIANLFVYILALYLIIKKVRVGKYVFFVIALIPQMIHLAASLSADTINNVIVLGIVALVFNLFIQKQKISKKQILLLIILIAAVAVLKRNLILVLFPLAFLPAQLFKENKNNKIPFNVHKWTLAAAAALMFGITYLIWSKLSFVYTVPAVGLPNPIEIHPNLFINLLFNTYLSDYGDLVLRGVFGEFSSFLYHFPTILVFLQIVILLLAYLYDPQRNIRTLAQNKWLVISMTSAFILSVFAITYGLYTEWGLKRGIQEYADGVQGRYFTALLVLLVPLFAWIGKYVSIRVKSEKFLFLIVASGQVLILAFYVLYTVKTLLGK